MTRLLLLILTAFLLGSCDKAENEYTSRVCYLRLDNSVHNDNTLRSAMTPGTNVFVTITVTYKSGGAQYFHFQDNQGSPASESVFNAIDKRTTVQLGMNNGLIVGFGNMNNQFNAYDLQCPNCFNPNAIPLKSYPLSINTAGIASCNSCKRTYNLHSGGNNIEGTGNKLTHYRASTTGPNGIMTVY